MHCLSQVSETVSRYCWLYAGLRLEGILAYVHAYFRAADLRSRLGLGFSGRLAPRWLGIVSEPSHDPDQDSPPMDGKRRRHFIHYTVALAPVNTFLLEITILETAHTGNSPLPSLTPVLRPTRIDA
jgi:hypothetical protein